MPFLRSCYGMPNTLVHLGLNGILTRAAWRDADLKWIYLGCILPDLPWILQRVVKLVAPDTDRYSLLLYVSSQASLFFCLILAGSLAALSTRAGRTFAILALGSLLHLLLDACQIKWGNGVHIAAPLSWRLTNFGFLWPENPVIYAATAFGLAYYGLAWRKVLKARRDIVLRRPIRVAAFAILLGLYLTLPITLVEGARRADCYYVATLLAHSERPGKRVAFDRAVYTPSPAPGRIRTFAGESIEVEGMALPRPAVVSLRGVFRTPEQIEVDAYHVHRSRLRDLASYLGLILVALAWLRYVVAALRRPCRCET